MFMRRIIRIANSRQGRRAILGAVAYARSPAGQARIEQVRRQIADRRGRRQPAR
jgi:hypothetical protein